MHKISPSILLIIDEPKLQNWINWLIEELLADQACHFLVTRITQKTIIKHKWLHWHLQLDKKIFGSSSDAFELQELPDQLEQCQIEDIGSELLPKVDYVLYLANHNFDESLLNYCKKGVLFFTHGAKENTSPAFLGYNEMLRLQGTICSTLRFLPTKSKSSHILSQTWSMQTDFAISRNRSEHFWKLAALLKREFTSLIENKGQLPIKSIGSKLLKHSDQKLPSISQSLINLSRHGKRIVEKTIRKLFMREQWILLIANEDELSCSEQLTKEKLNQFTKILPPKDVFWADPFLVKENDQLFLFLEELPFSTGKGHLSVMELNEKGECSKPVKILEKPYHLSYPFVFKHQGKYFMIPESNEARNIQLYESVAFPYQWKHKMDLLQDVKAFDATICFHENKWWMFATIASPENMGQNDELHLFYADRPDTDQWIRHPQNPIISDVRKARPAGQIFRAENKLIRPSQDCSLKYGYGWNWNEIELMTETQYQERRIQNIRPDWEESIKRTHTFNKAGGIMVMDGIRYISKYY